MMGTMRQDILAALPATVADLVVRFQRKPKTILTYLRQLQFVGKARLVGERWEQI